MLELLPFLAIIYRRCTTRRMRETDRERNTETNSSNMIYGSINLKQYSFEKRYSTAWYQYLQRRSNHVNPFLSLSFFSLSLEPSRTAFESRFDSHILFIYAFPSSIELSLSILLDFFFLRLSHIVLSIFNSFYSMVFYNSLICTLATTMNTINWLLQICFSFCFAFVIDNINHIQLQFCCLKWFTVIHKIRTRRFSSLLSNWCLVSIIQRVNINGFSQSYFTVILNSTINLLLLYSSFSNRLLQSGWRARRLIWSSRQV